MLRIIHGNFAVNILTNNFDDTLHKRMLIDHKRILNGTL